MVQRQQGRILNIVGSESPQTSAREPLLLAAEAFVRTLGQGLLSEVATAGITISTMCAGLTDLRALPPDALAALAYRGLMSGQGLIGPAA